MRPSLKKYRDAQDPNVSEIENELLNGKKTGHWMWFVFPQIVTLGQSPTSLKYGIRSPKEAISYINDPLLGLRLHKWTHLVLGNKNKVIEKIFDGVDALKLCSSMTLFELAASNPEVFTEVIETFYNGKRCEKTSEWWKNQQEN